MGKENEISGYKYLSSKRPEYNVQEQLFDAVPEAGDACLDRDVLHLRIDERHDVLDRAETIKDGDLPTVYQLQHSLD